MSRVVGRRLRRVPVGVSTGAVLGTVVVAIAALLLPWGGVPASGAPLAYTFSPIANMPFGTMVDTLTGRMRSPEQLKAQFAVPSMDELFMQLARPVAGPAHP